MSVQKEVSKVVAPVTTPQVVTPTTVVSRKHLSRHTIAKYAWRFDRSSSTVAHMIRNEYKLSPSEEAQVLARISDMRIKFMTARLRQCCNIDIVTVWRRRTSINLFRYPASLVVGVYGRPSHCSCSSRHTVCQQSAIAHFRLQPLRSGTLCQMTFSLHLQFLPSIDF